MKILSMRAFVVFVLLNLVVSPIIVTAVAADDAYGTEYRVSYMSIPYGNGVDDNHDGTIDDINETDVYYGNKNITIDDRVVNTWSDTFSFPSPHENGIEIGGPYETPYEVSITNVDPTSSISPSYSCYAVTDINGSFDYHIKTNVINLLTYYISLSPAGLMNGASETWFRSAIIWNDKIFDEYYLNVFDSNGALVYATMDTSGGLKTSPYENIIHDASTYDRIYQKLNMNFRTGERYTFKEYVTTKDDVPINRFNCFFLDFFDIGGDNETNTYVFSGSPFANKIPRECSWSMIAVIGMGPGGVELPIWSDTLYNSSYRPEVITSMIRGGDTEMNVTSARFIIPLRCTMAVSVTIFVKTWSGTSVSSWVTSATFTDFPVTGTIDVFMNVDDPDPTQNNTYQLKICITGLNVSNNAVVFKTYPSLGDITAVNHNTSYVDIYHFATQVELANETNVNVNVQQSINWWTVLIGIGLIIGAILLIVATWGTLTAPALALLSGTIISGTSVLTISLGGVALGYVAGGILVLLGSAVIWQGLQGYDIVPDMWRVLLDVVNGLMALGTALWNFLLQVIEAIGWFINAIMTWGGDVLNAVAQVIYFIIFILVLTLWGIFLSTMRYVAVGDAEGAWASMIKPFMKSYKWVRKRPVYKVGTKVATMAVTKGMSGGFKK